jgi:hypothetical protein
MSLYHCVADYKLYKNNYVHHESKINMVLLVLLGYSLQQKLETCFGGDYSFPELIYLSVGTKENYNSSIPKHEA